MEDIKNSSPLLIKYLRAYESNRSSRVFAPLAETYRKLGKIDDALKVLKEGIRYHPTYTLGYLVLAHCYFDKNQFEFAYNTLRPLVVDNLDNVGLQKLFAETAEKLMYLEEALETYKYLLFINPRDSNISEKVKNLEASILQERSSYLIVEDKKKSHTNDLLSDEDDWVRIDLVQKKEESQHLKKLDLVSNSNEDWVVKKPGEAQEFFDEEKASQLDDQVEDASLEEEAINRELLSGFEDQAPVMTLTLVDIYCAQKLYSKAEEVLEKILEITPKDERILAKLKQVKTLANARSLPSSQNEDLMHAYDQAMKTKKSKLIVLENKFADFLHKLKHEAHRHT